VDNFEDGATQVIKALGEYQKLFEKIKPNDKPNKSPEGQPKDIIEQ